MCKIDIKMDLKETEVEIVLWIQVVSFCEHQIKSSVCVEVGERFDLQSYSEFLKKVAVCYSELVYLVR